VIAAATTRPAVLPVPRNRDGARRGPAYRYRPRGRLDRCPARYCRPEHREPGGLPRLTACREREGFARSRRPDDHLHTCAVPAEAPDHLLLIGSNGRALGDRVIDGSVGRDAGFRVSAVERVGDNALLHAQQLGGRVAGACHDGADKPSVTSPDDVLPSERPAGLGERDDLAIRQEPVDERLDLSHGRSVTRGRGDCANDVSPIERRLLRRDSVA
jgi:hypothetical protein